MVIKFADTYIATLAMLTSGWTEYIAGTTDLYPRGPPRTPSEGIGGLEGQLMEGNIPGSMAELIHRVSMDDMASTMVIQ
eukprot:CAMPEP_0184870254 /NCGR_PEP_ID=MMETSP0580-20130426/36897_1 /TAXON_ID=1118495 /ORGANISM="Dactyliosolen fragilissimus" /LENGTH=78 /DNA_ID=CAMNT_0027372239 /DNA_START=713 /DNA_END=950 /DNA_ORIENTATION=+